MKVKSLNEANLNSAKKTIRDALNKALSNYLKKSEYKIKIYSEPVDRYLMIEIITTASTGDFLKAKKDIDRVVVRYGSFGFTGSSGGKWEAELFL